MEPVEHGAGLPWQRRPDGAHEVLLLLLALRQDDVGRVRCAAHLFSPVAARELDDDGSAMESSAYGRRSLQNGTADGTSILEGIRVGNPGHGRLWTIDQSCMTEHNRKDSRLPSLEPF